MSNQKKQKPIKVTTYKFDDVDKHIGMVAKSAGSLQSKIHSLAVTIAKHWHDNPKQGADCLAKLNALMMASPYHSNAFSKWVGGLWPVMWSEENKTFFVHKDSKLMGKQLVAIRETPFWKFSPPPAPKPFLMGDAIQKILDTAERREKKPVDGDDIHTSALKLLREAVSIIDKENEESRVQEVLAKTES